MREGSRFGVPFRSLFTREKHTGARVFGSLGVLLGTTSVEVVDTQVHNPFSDRLIHLLQCICILQGFTIF